MAKKNSDYWKGRFEQLEEASHKKAEAVYASIENSYIQAQREIESKINNWYVRFANNNQITINEAKRLLNSQELKELKWDIQEYIKYGKENRLNDIWMKELENASAKFHISRLESLKIQTQQSMEVLFGNQLDEIDKMASNIYSDEYYHSCYELQKGFNIGWKIASIDENKLQKIASKPWAIDGKNFSERIWGNKTKMVNELHNQLTIMCVQGKSPDNAINYMSKKFNTSKSQAGNLVMTESAYFSSLAQKDCFNDLDVEKYENVATLDSHTSAICQDMDGTVFDMNNFEPGVTAPPFHNYCRTTTVPHFDDDYDFVGERAARDDKGNTYYVPDNLKYKDWYNKYVVDGEELKKEMKNVKINNNIRQWKNFTTMDEAKEYVYNNYKDSDIDKIKNVEAMNVTFDTLDELQSKYPLNNEIFVRNKTISNAAANGNYQGININTSHFNKASRKALVGDDWIEDLNKQIEDLKQYLGNMKYKQKPIENGIRRLEQQKKFKCYSISGSYADLESIKATITHEYGHVIADQYFGQINKFKANKNFDYFDSNECWQKCMDVASVYNEALRNNDIYDISYYASTDQYEFFAECFAKKQMGGILPDYINEMLERVLKNGK
jgi:SPP1 gp7 family putative phage head morphogenesis protein